MEQTLTMTRILKYSLYFLFLPIWWLQRLIPRNKNIWIFGAWNGHRFSDNSRSLFLYVKKNHPEIKPIWITRDKEIQHLINADGSICHLANSPKGIYFSLIAKKVFVSCGKRDVNSFFIHGAHWIQLWHGSPFKKIGLDDKYSNHNTFFQRVIVKKAFPFATELNYHRIVSNAPFFTPILSSAFDTIASRIMETGSPRNDVFHSDHEHFFNTALRVKYHECKILYYLPTFRGHKGVNSLFGLSDYDVEKTGSFLEEHNLVLVSKAHYVDNKLDSIGEEHERIIHLADEEVPDINEMLKDADLLITDYSSIYFDYLLTERPVIFAAFDLTEYINGNRELPFLYEDVVSGPVIKNCHELFKALSKIWDDSKYHQLVKEKNKQFNKYHDGQNSKRVFEALNEV